MLRVIVTNIQRSFRIWEGGDYEVCLYYRQNFGHYRGSELGSCRVIPLRRDRRSIRCDVDDSNHNLRLDRVSRSFQARQLLPTLLWRRWRMLRKVRMP